MRLGRKGRVSMTTSHADSSAAPAEKQASKYVLQDWEPNNPEKWDSKLAWRTLTITTYSLILGFCVWFLPSAIAPKLTLLGFNLSASQLYWLTALPGLAAGPKAQSFPEDDAPYQGA